MKKIYDIDDYKINISDISVIQQEQEKTTLYMNNGLTFMFSYHYNSNPTTKQQCKELVDAWEVYMNQEGF